jgi:hypothetical protein
MAKGGAREGAGRPTRAKELKLIEKLGPMEDEALKQLFAGVKSGDFQFIKLYMEYRFGKPKEQVDITSGGNEIAQWTMIPATKK